MYFRRTSDERRRRHADLEGLESWRMRVWLIVPILAFPATAVACPFCGGKGASGLLENLLLVAGLWFGARALMRALQKRQRRAAERDTSPSADSAADPRA
jgi:hypothetical protein